MLFACGVYAGADPLTGKRHDLVEVIPPGPKAAASPRPPAMRLLAQVDERRNPRTNATLDQLLDRYLETLDVGPTTHAMYAKYLEKHVRPFVGRLKAGAVGVEVLDSLYAELRRCRIHCTGGRGVDHRTPRPHECDERCRPHRCNPLSSTTIRHIHFILRAAYEKGVRWRWVGANPVVDGRRARGEEARSAAAVVGGGRADRRGGVGGPGLGHARLADDDDRRAAGRAVRAAVVERRPRPGRHHAAAGDRAVRP